MSYKNRKPIMLCKNACALIWIYTRNDEMFDIMYGAYEKYDPLTCYEEAAKEFIKQLDGHHSISFLEALKKEIDITLKNH